MVIYPKQFSKNKDKTIKKFGSKKQIPPVIDYEKEVPKMPKRMRLSLICQNLMIYAIPSPKFHYLQKLCPGKVKTLLQLIVIKLILLITVII